MAKMEFQLLLALLAISSTHAAIHDGICIKQVAPAGSKPFPNISDVFQVDIQMNIAANKTTRHLFEIFDSPNGRAIIGETEATGPGNNISLTGYDIYNFNTNQIVEVFQLPDTSYFCNASQLDGKGADTFMFGATASSTNGFTAKSAFMIDPKYPPKYEGTDTLDNGLMVEKWSDCQWIAVMDATVKVMWYFTDPSWVSPLGVQIPMMLTVEGMAYHPITTGRQIKHSYTFTGFNDFIPDHSKPFFQVPPGTVCPHLKDFDVGPPTQHIVPAVAQKGYFSFKAEYVQQTYAGAGLVTDMREYYDKTLQMSRYDYTPKGMLTAFFDNNVDYEVSEVHDFVTGLAYITDKIHGNCTVKTLFDSQQFDVEGTEGNHVRMKTVNEFFGLTGTDGSRMGWTYTGQRKMRDILVDVYIAERTGFPPHAGPDVKSVWEIAFMSPTYLDVSQDAQVQISEPMRIYAKIPDINFEMTYNIYDFNEDEPDSWIFRIDHCFTDDQKTNVHFRLPGDQVAMIENNMKVFRYFLLANIIGYTDILPSRVANLRWMVSDRNGDILVQFQILDPPTLPGSTTTQIPANYMMPTVAAIDILRAAINNGSFIVEGGSIRDMVTIIAVPNSLSHSRLNITEVEELVETKIQLDAGAAAGIAIAFFVGGIGVGVLIIFLINKLRPGASPPTLTMSFSNKNYDS